jgi:hypothetical protein
MLGERRWSMLKRRGEEIKVMHDEKKMFFYKL